MISGPLFWLKVGGIAVVAIIIGWVGLTVNGWRQDSTKLVAVRQELSDVKAAQAASHKASEDLQGELQTLRDAARKPSPVVRMCKPAKPVPEAGTERDGAAPGTGELPQEAGPDIGKDLYDLADDADELAARLRACQALLR